MGQNVTITTSGGETRVISPWNGRFVEAARDLGGRWRGEAWCFDARDEERVRALCMDAYGTDGTRDERCTLRVTAPEDGLSECRGPITVHGRVLARAFGRDSGAKLGDGVILLAGGVTSGGSTKNWNTKILGNTILLVRDFPRAAAGELCAKRPERYAIEDEPGGTPQPAAAEGSGWVIFGAGQDTEGGPQAPPQPSLPPAGATITVDAQAWERGWRALDLLLGHLPMLAPEPGIVTRQLIEEAQAALDAMRREGPCQEQGGQP